MKIIALLVLVMASYGSFGQTREFYGGVNTSNYLINQEGIISSQRYIPGVQFGFMMGGKSRNLFGNLKRISPHLSFEYNQSHYEFDQVRNEEVTSHFIDVHNLRVSVPVHLRLSKNEKRLQIFLNGAPGINVTGLQLENGQIYSHAPIKTIDLFVNAGGGVFLNTAKKSYESDGFKFSGISLSANKYIPLTFGRWGNASVSSLDQYQFNVGLRFSHYKKPATRKVFDIFRRNND